MSVTRDSTVIQVSSVALIACVVAAVILYWFAPTEANLKTEFWKSVFDKVALGGLLAAFALLVGWWIDPVKARRAFFLNQQLTASTEILSSAARLADAAAEWLYHDAPEGSKGQGRTPYGKTFAQEIEQFGKQLDTRQPLLPTHLVTALCQLLENLWRATQRRIRQTA